MKPDQTLKLLIVDDHAVVLEGLDAMLGVDPLFESIATASSPDDALNACEGFHPDVILLDLRMPQCDGFSALGMFLRRWPEVKILILSASATAAEINLARRVGAKGYLCKSASRAALLEAIRAVAEGGTFFPSAPARRVHPHDLSGRELEVLRQFGLGLSNQQLGMALGISSETVKSHAKSIFQKLGVSNRVEALARAYELGIVGDQPPPNLSENPPPGGW
jgi:two-component system NarL family response regulator